MGHNNENRIISSRVVRRYRSSMRRCMRRRSIVDRDVVRPQRRQLMASPLPHLHVVGYVYGRAAVRCREHQPEFLDRRFRTPATGPVWPRATNSCSMALPRPRVTPAIAMRFFGPAMVSTFSITCDRLKAPIRHSAPADCSSHQWRANTRLAAWRIAPATAPPERRAGGGQVSQYRDQARIRHIRA
jgi:hypothetical protein